MDDIKALLNKRQFNEPPELIAIKQYVLESTGAICKASISAEMIVVTVSSAALANTLRLNVHRMKQVAQTTKRIVFRISS